MLTAVDDAVQLVVDRPYKAGESIVVWYDIFLSCNYVADKQITCWSLIIS